jgi:hypothetical protein
MMFWMTNEQFSRASQDWSTRWAKDIATPWAEEMAYRMGKKDRGNLTGRAIMMVGVPLSWMVGLWKRKVRPGRRPTGLSKGLVLILIFCILKSIAQIGKLFEGK